MNLVIISSAINTCLAPLSYYPVRSLYSPQERFEQTLQSINSLEKIPDKKILFIETTLIPSFENEIMERVDFYANIYHGNEAVVDGPHKGIGEALSIIRGIGAVELSDYDNVYKLSGRYFLTNDFDYNRWDNDNTLFLPSAVVNGLLTVFYKINRRDYYPWMAALYELYETKYILSIETFLANKMQGFTPIDKIGVEGLTHGGTHVIF